MGTEYSESMFLFETIRETMHCLPLHCFYYYKRLDSIHYINYMGRWVCNSRIRDNALPHLKCR